MLSPPCNSTRAPAKSACGGAPHGVCPYSRVPGPRGRGRSHEHRVPGDGAGPTGARYLGTRQVPRVPGPWGHSRSHGRWVPGDGAGPTGARYLGTWQVPQAPGPWGWGRSHVGLKTQNFPPRPCHGARRRAGFLVPDSLPGRRPSPALVLGCVLVLSSLLCV